MKHAFYFVAKAFGLRYNIHEVDIILVPLYSEQSEHTNAQRVHPPEAALRMSISAASQKLERLNPLEAPYLLADMV